LQVPLHRFLRLIGVCLDKAGQSRRLLVHLGVVLHRAGAQRVETNVYPPVLLGKAHVVAHQFRLRHLGQVQFLAQEVSRRKVRLRHVQCRQHGGTTPLRAEFIDHGLCPLELYRHGVVLSSAH